MIGRNAYCKFTQCQFAEYTVPGQLLSQEMAGGIYEIVTLGKHYYRPIGADPVDSETGRVHTINESIDGSVFDRWRADLTYRPKNLVEWASRKQVANQGLLNGAVHAVDPGLAVDPSPVQAISLPTAPVK